MIYLLLIVGFGLLIKGADLMVDGASGLAKKFGVSDLVIGLTIVAFGTSAPELVVNVISSVAGSNDLVLGNVIGSNIANIFLILGIGALIYPLVVENTTARKEIPFSLLGMIILGLMVNDAFIDNTAFNVLSRIDGLILLGFFVIFLYYAYEVAIRSKEKVETDKLKKQPTRKVVGMIIIGIAGLVFGGDMVVNNAVKIAQQRGMSEKAIGLSIVAIGTSLPELATTIVAVMKKRVSIAIGNVVGSNIFNVLFVLAISTIVSPVVFNPANNIDIIMNIFASVLLFVFLYLGITHKLQKRQGITFLLIYAGYMTFTLVSG